VKFIKMHGAGNDYVYVDCFEERVDDPAALAPRISDRHFGVGSDGLILAMPSEAADVRMRMFNADGSEAEMCGNGIRGVAKYAFDHGLVHSDEITVETKAGVKSLKLFVAERKVRRARVNMGPPRLARKDIPVAGPAGEEAIDIEIPLGDVTLRGTCVSMGNPHCVIYVDDVENFPVHDLGPQAENHELFPQRANIEFTQILSSSEVRVRVWERGSGETLACGTGASAVCVAGARTGRTDRKLLVRLLGGDLEIEWAPDGDVYLTGPSEEVFCGEWPE